MPTFSVWHENGEQWDPNNIDPPALKCVARTAVEAAGRLADSSDDLSFGEFIVRNDELKTYHHVTLARGGWTVLSDRRTSLEELCAP